MKTCSRCEISQDVSFYSKNQNICKKCFCEYVKKLHKEKGRSYQRTKKVLKDNKSCYICGSTKYLEFDHTNPESKTITIGRSQSSKSILKESLLCRFLCIWCHRLHTFKTRELDQTDDLVKRKQLIENAKEDINGKICNGLLCNGKSLPIDFFYLKNGKPKGFCKHCQYKRDYNTRQFIKQFINEKKIEIGHCELCNEKVENGNECCFDFDHLDPRTKIMEIARFACLNSRNTSRILDEIKKCRLLCCKCHFDHTNSVKIYHTKLVKI